VPAAAVIPAPIAYIKIAAVKASVVGFRSNGMAVLLSFVLASTLFGLNLGEVVACYRFAPLL
jgi:hypothetical protein